MQLQEKEFYPDPEDPPGGGENMMAGGGGENGFEEGGSQSMMGGGGVGPVLRWSLVPVEVMEYTPYGLPTIHASLDQGTGGGFGRLVSATDGAQLEGTTQTAAAAVALEPRFGPTPPNGQGQFTCQSSFGWRILYAGREWDPGNRTYSNRQRVYAPEECRFLSRDPEGYDYSLDQYAYCSGDPINFLDRTGGWPEWFDDAIDNISSAVDGMEATVYGAIDSIEAGMTEAYIEVKKEVKDQWEGQVWAFTTGAAEDSLIGFTSEYSHWASNGVIPTFHNPCNANQALGAEIGRLTTTTSDVIMVVAGAPKTVGALRNVVRNGTKEVTECVVKNSFPAGTLVLTPNGLVPIDEVWNGDAVVARDPNSNDAASEFCVVGMYAHEATDLVEIEFSSGSKLAATPNHPIWVEGAGWLDAGYLRPGMELLTADGTTIAIADVKHICDPQMVYNLSVRDVGVFYVGGDRVLVHNKNICTELHHIVARNAKKAGDSRNVLAKFSIDINDSENLIRLDADFHHHLHTNAYYDQVNYALSTAKNKKEAQDTLNVLSKALQNGWSPR